VIRSSRKKRTGLRKGLQGLTRTVGICPAIRGEETTRGQLPGARPIYGLLLESWRATRLGPYDLGLLANASNVPFYLWVGDEDKERKSSLDTFRTSLTAVGNTPKVVVTVGVGHNYRAEDTGALEAWLLQCTRGTPKHFSFPPFASVLGTRSR
jgi:hypothetical protein